MSEELPLDWSINVTDVSERGTKLDREATLEERVAVAEALDILSCEHLVLVGRIRRQAGGRYLLEGQIEARVSQSCVVSLDPVPDTLSFDLNVEFQPASDKDKSDSESDLGDPFEATEFEPIEAGRLNLGRVVFEEIASSLDPFPRAEGVELETKESGGDASSPGPENPFAKLAALKNKT